MDLTVIIPTIPERAHLLVDAKASVKGQVRPAGTKAPKVVVVVDTDRRGPAAVRNEAAAAVSTSWVTFLDDDDVWLPQHLAALAPHRDTADVIYSLGHVVGRPGWDPQLEAFDAARLRQVNYIPLTGLIRTDLFRRAGGFPVDAAYEDHGLWVALLDAGARFHCVPERTWLYRFGPWDSRSKEVWDGRRPGSDPAAPTPAPAAAPAMVPAMTPAADVTASVSIVVPFTPGACEHRDAAWAWVRARYELAHPTWEIIEAPGDPDCWSKGEALQAGVDRAAGELLVIADADSFVHAAGLVAAVSRVEQGEPWVCPHSSVWRLAERPTKDVLAGGPVDVPEKWRHRRYLTRRPYSGTIGGGIMVLTRDAWDVSGGIDPRFGGWGGEDKAWGRALATMAGATLRGPADLWHLWHPPAPLHRRPTQATERLAGRYWSALGNTEAMAALIEEVTDDDARDRGSVLAVPQP